MTFNRFATAAFFLAVAATACVMPAQSDTWWQLRAGQQMIATGEFALRDAFSHTVDGGYWPNHEWLSQIIFYGVYRAGGLPGLTAFAAAVVTLAWWIVWQLTPGSTRARLVLSTMAILPFVIEWSLRPQIFTLLFVAITLRLIVEKRYLLLPPLFALWGNMHGGVMVGGILLASHGVASVVSERRLLTRPMIIGGVCLLMTGASPLGFSLWTEVPQMLGRLKEYGVREWRPPSLTNPFLAPFWLMSVGFVYLAIRRQPWRDDPTRWAPVWGTVALTPVALNASRNVPALLLVMVPAVAMLIEGWPFLPDRPNRRERPAFNTAVLTMGCLAALTAVALSWSASIPKLQWRPLSGRVIAAIESCPESIYNRYDEGGYLIWFVPARKVFIDSRQDPYPVELVREHIRVETTGEYADLFARYSIGCAFVPRETLLADRLRRDGWALLYQDSVWNVLARPGTVHSIG